VCLYAMCTDHGAGCHNIDYVHADEFLAKYWTAPWGWFLCEPKHVGANVITVILTIL
jgi:hypothetical protein